MRTFLLICFLSLVAKNAVSADDFFVERVRFLQATKLLQRGDEAGFLSQLKLLQGYPIQHYLQYQWIVKKIDSDAADVPQLLLNFEKHYPYSHLLSQLLAKRQRHLFERRDWRGFLAASKHPKARDYRCRKLQAQLRLKKISADLKLLSEIWLNQSLRSKTCKQLSALLLETVQPTAWLIWSRIDQLMAAGRWRSAQQMETYMGSRDKALLALWIDAYRNPGDNAENPALREDNLFNRKVVLHQHKRWSTFAADAADKHWQLIRKNYAFEHDQLAEADRYIALQTAYSHLPQSTARLNALGETDSQIEGWKLRVALRNQQWQFVSRQIEALPENEQSSDQWQYWLARSYRETGREAEAAERYRLLAKKTSYYGFLAADRLGTGYAIFEESFAQSDARRAEMLSNDELLRAREYFFVGLPVDARRAWRRYTQSLGEDENALLMAAGLAAEWGWHDRAIQTVAQTSVKRALSLRFPTPYRDKVLAVAKRDAIDPSWIYGVMRRESAFINDIRSSAGAVGLMQLLPTTAKYVAKKVGQKVSNGDLTDENVSISLGAHYLRQLRDRFNHSVLATAAYNAGPNRVAKWLPDSKLLPADVWVDTIPITETRRYVRAVMAYATIFEWRMWQSVTSLNIRMPPIPAASQ